MIVLSPGPVAGFIARRAVRTLPRPAGQLVDWRYQARDEIIGWHLDQVHHVGGLRVAAHPHAPYPAGVFMYPYQGFDAVEVWNGLWASDLPWNADNEARWPNGAAAWLRACKAGGGGRRWGTATPIWRTRSAFRRPLS